jgi:lipopolysaccharide transport system ATP-binding protein
MAVALRTHSLGKTYRVGGRRGRRAFRALEGVTIDVSAGETVGLIGRNGAGKTTLLRILSQITEPTDGYAQVRGRVASLLEVGTGFHPDLTGRENVFLNAVTLGMSRADVRRRFDSIVDFAGVHEFVDAPVRQYSTGMYMRLAFAVAAHVEPDVLLVDEVLAVGDAEFQKRCLGVMDDVGRDGRTVLFVSHNVNAVKALCPRAILLEGGQVAADGDASDVIRRYLGSARASAAEAVWPERATAPGNEVYRLHAVRIVRDGEVRANVRADEEFEIAVDYWNLVDDARLGVTVVVQDANGQPLFSSLSNRDEKWHMQRRAAGRYRSACLIPGDLLAEGRCSVSVVLWGEGYSSSYTETDVVEFEVFEDPSARGDYLGDWVGAVRPRLVWRTEQLD